MSLFRRSFSRRLPDRLLEIAERIYVFDSCLATSPMNEKDFRSYLGTVVTSLHRFHAGASFMVFNIGEGDQTSLLSDILIDYDMAVVDYPRHYEGYSMLPLEMIHYFLRSSESWLSLEGQKNVILMHCEKGGWPVLAFMLAGLLLYRKQYKGELKTLEMVSKQAPKEFFSVLSPINPRASQLRYLRYITGRDLASDWPPSDAPLVVDYLLLHNLPLFNAGKGCRPVVRVYGQDPSAKMNRDPRLLLSTAMTEEHVWQYPKEECVFVKLELRCHVQGDVFLECVHLHDDLVSEEMIFKAMFHTGFIQANILALNSDEIDVSWNAKYKLPKDFKAEVLFRDINEAPQHIAMELGGAEEYHDSDNEFYEVEEIFTPSGSPEPKTGLKIVTDQDASLVEIKNKDCTLRNGAPRWDFDNGITDLATSRDIPLEKGDSTESSERVPRKEDIVVTDLSSFKARHIDEGQPKQASEIEAAAGSTKQALSADPITSASEGIVGADSIISASKDIVGAKPVISALKDIVGPEPVIDALKDFVRAESVISAPKDTTGAEPVISASKDTATAEPIASTSKDIVRAEPVISAPKVTAGGEPVISASKDTAIAEPVPSASKDIVRAEPVISAPKGTAGAEPVVSASKDTARAEPVSSTSKAIVGAEPVRSALKEIVGAEPIICATKDMVGVEPFITTPKDIVIDNRNHKYASEIESDISAPTIGSESTKTASENIVLVDDKYYKQASETNSDTIASENIAVVDIKKHKEASETQSEVHADEGHNMLASEIITSALKTIVVDDRHHKQDPEAAQQVILPASGAESDISASKNVVLVRDLNPKQVSEIELDNSASKNIVVVDTGNHKQVSETKLDSGELKNILVIDTRNHKQLSEIEVDISESKNIVKVDNGNHKQASETQSDINTSKNNVVIADRNYKKDPEPEISGPKKIIVVDDRSQSQDVKVKIEPKTISSSSKTKHQKRNKWQEMTAKTITQQRVVPQWVPRSKAPATEPAKPKAPAYKWVPKGAVTPADEK